jgi:hypothetical protein
MRHRRRAAHDELPAGNRHRRHLIHDTTATLHPTPRLEQLSNIGTVPCSGPNDDQETGNVMVEHTYWLRDVPTTCGVPTVGAGYDQGFR